MRNKLRLKARRFLGVDDFINLRKNVIELNNLQELKKVFSWTLDPIIDYPDLSEYRYIEDVNQRRLRDFESLATTVCNINPTVCLDIGTGKGSSAALMAVNAPNSTVYTVNIPPDEYEEGGILTTMKLEHEQIGSYYREQGLKNVSQILANTASWEPDIGSIDIAFIDGSHDTKFVINDTLKVLKHMTPGSFLLWHDFNLSLVHNYHWIRSVCLGVDELFAMDVLKGKVFHVQDSWVGIYCVPDSRQTKRFDDE